MHRNLSRSRAALLALACATGLPLAQASGPKSDASVVVRDGYLYTTSPNHSGLAVVSATRAASANGVIPVGDSRVYGKVFDKDRKLSVSQWQAVLSMDAYPENGTTNYQDVGPWRYCEVDYEATVGISDYRGNTFGPEGVTTIGDFPSYFKQAFAPYVLGKTNATNTDMLNWGAQVTGVSKSSFQADDQGLDPYPSRSRKDSAKRAALGKICKALQAQFDSNQDPYVMSHYAHIHNDKVVPSLTALKGLGFTSFATHNLMGLAFQVQVNTGSIASISAFKTVKAHGDCGSMAAELCFATYLTDQYIRWLKSPSLGDDAGNCWRANMALDIYKKDNSMSDVNVVKSVITSKYPNNSGSCPSSGVHWSKTMSWN